MKRTIESLTPPANKQVMWLDISQEVKQLKAYINGEWVVVNGDTKNNEETTVKNGKPDEEITQYVPRWHGIENPFGDIWNLVDGVTSNPTSVELNGIKYSEIHATDDPSVYSDSDYSKMRLVGVAICGNSYTREWDLGNTAEIIPRMSGGNATQFKCDFYGVQSENIRPLFLGGTASSSSYAGLGGFLSKKYSDNTFFDDTGFRSSCVID